MRTGIALALKTELVACRESLIVETLNATVTLTKNLWCINQTIASIQCGATGLKTLDLDIISINCSALVETTISVIGQLVLLVEIVYRKDNIKEAEERLFSPFQ